MAQKPLDKQDFLCPICLDVLNDPVTIPCGHSYCMTCIQLNWDQQGGRYSCPECRKSFRTKPALVKNIMLAALAHQLKTTPPAEHCYAGPKDVSCDMCSGRKLKAVKSCLQCLVSYCENHLQPHNEVAALQKHQLVEPSKDLCEHLCSEHNELKKIFCRNDQTLLCVICCMDHHKNHDTVSAAAERAYWQPHLETKMVQLLRTIQDKETDLECLQQETKDINSAAQEAMKRSRDNFAKIVLHLGTIRRKAEQQIQVRRETKLRRVKELQDQLYEDIGEVRRTFTQMTALSNTANHTHFLQQYSSLMTNIPCLDSRKIDTAAPKTFLKDVTTASTFSDQLLAQLNANEFQSQHPTPTTRADFLKYARKITLDPNTAHTGLALPFPNRETFLNIQTLNYPYHPERFDHYRQVLSQEGLTGRCYWEVGWTGEGCFRMAVSYKNIKRKGNSRECAFGNNEKSWALENNHNSFSFWFNEVDSKLSCPKSYRIGVYLDHSAGALSFYSISRVSQTMILLHSIQTKFTKPLHVGVWFNWGYMGNSVYFPVLV